MFKPVSTKVSFPELEEEILSFWKKNKIFEKSVANRKESKRWTFLDGPPFITGMPHYGTLLSSLPKDLYPRFKTMQGFKVRRVWGWDCHGLPAENKVETKLGLISKKEIEEKVGIKKFIDECKNYVSEVSGEWGWYIDHIGRWVDFENAYKTMDLSYMESVMWVFKNMYDKGFIYKGLRVSLYCPHCATPISNFEVAMDADNYKEMNDFATTYKYELIDKNSKEKTFILAWSTTPWNKIVTPALAVNPKLTYVKVRQGEEYYVLAESTIGILHKNEKYKIVEKFKGEDLVGVKFVPHYDYYKILEGKKAFEIIPGDFVTSDEGTGVVTIAAYGEEDLKVMQELGVHIEMHLDEEGTIKKDVPKFGGMYYLKANKYVNEDLMNRGLIYDDKQIPHNVPLCWRCHTRLYYGPQDAWYVDIKKIKPLLKKTNEDINWFPKHFKHGRFLKSIENAPDWNISRSRYWGSPVPVWECSTCGERFVPGSIKDLEDASGQKILDLHKPDIDEIIVKCRSCGGDSIRTPEVLDSWIEAGSASFAERHYPFEKVNGASQDIEDFFPPDFIAEYTGQIRAWFYVLHVIGACLYESKAFKNVLVEGVILGTDGRKMSKNYGNYPDPKELLKKYGGDALRLYLLGSPVMNGEDIIISEDQYKMQVRGMMLILWNSYNFFITYSNSDNWDYKKAQKNKPNNILDRWVLSILNNLIRDVTEDLENFNSIDAISRMQKFIDDFSTWYIRRSRDRVGASAEDLEDKNSFYITSYSVLVLFCKLLAPFAPFISESIYKNLTGEESVHLEYWPVFDRTLIDQDLERQMSIVRKIVESGHAERKQKNLKVRQPLLRAKIFINEQEKILDEFFSLIKDELNVKNIEIELSEKYSVEYDLAITKELEDEGNARGIVRSIQEARKVLGTKIDEYVDVQIPSWPSGFEGYIKKHALVRKLEKGNELEVKRS